MSFSVKYAIAGAAYENIKIQVKGDTVSDLAQNLADARSLDEQIMAAYDRLIDYRDNRERVISHAANRLIMDDPELGAKILSVTPVEGAPEAGAEQDGPSDQPVKFWDREAPVDPTVGAAPAAKPVGKISLL